MTTSRRGAAKTQRATTNAPAPDPELTPIDSGVEVWRNNTPGTTYFTKLGEYGKRMTELVHGGRTFTLTPAERRINQSGYAGPEQDLFVNGTFQPVTLLDGEPDTPQLRENPNTLTDRDIQRLFKIRGEAFAQRIGEISSEIVLRRVLDMAREPRHGVTLHQYEMIKMREMELKGELDEPPADAKPELGDQSRAVTPR